MNVLITGAAGMIGRKLTARLVRDSALAGRPIEAMTLADVAAPSAPSTSIRIRTVATDIAAAGAAASLVSDRPDVIFHLAAVKIPFIQGLHGDGPGEMAVGHKGRARLPQ